MGLEPTTSELEVQRAIRCATAAMSYRERQILRDPKMIFIENGLSEVFAALTVVNACLYSKPTSLLQEIKRKRMMIIVSNIP